MLGRLLKKATLQSRPNKGDFVRALALSVWTERGGEPSESAMIYLPLPRLVFPTHAPFFGNHEGAVYIALPEIYLPALLEIFGQGLEYAAKNSFLDPPLKATMASLVGRVAFRKVLPGRARTQYPEDGVQEVARISPGPASAIFSSRWVWDKRLQHFPLLVGEVHAAVLLPLEGHITEPLYPPFRIYEIASRWISHI